MLIMTFVLIVSDDLRIFSYSFSSSRDRRNRLLKIAVLGILYIIKCEYYTFITFFLIHIPFSRIPVFDDSVCVHFHYLFCIFLYLLLTLIHTVILTNLNRTQLFRFTETILIYNKPIY